MRELRDVMAEALDDTSLELGTWDAARSRWVDADQRELRLPAADAPGRVARVLQDAENRPIAVLVHDRALLEEPLLVDALASSMHGAIASLQTESALAGERAHSAAVAEEERRRIERDLHDGAQQRLLALRMKLGVTGRLLENDPRRAAALIAEMGPDIDAAISELRALAHGIAPPLLAERGLATALAEAASHAAIPVATALEDVGRAEPAAERAIYFCCVEALQNAAKHAGSDATAKLTLARDGAALTFSVEDNGRTEDGARRMAEGHGIQNMRARVIALGGSLDVSADDGSGVRVFGRIPIAQD
jgi:signal transduction histidine kinase